MDQKTYDALEKWASDELRSVNAQIEILLKKALKEAGRIKEIRLVENDIKEPADVHNGWFSLYIFLK